MCSQRAETRDRQTDRDRDGVRQREIHTHTHTHRGDKKVETERQREKGRERGGERDRGRERERERERGSTHYCLFIFEGNSRMNCAAAEKFYVDFGRRSKGHNAKIVIRQGLKYKFPQSVDLSL